MDLVVTKRLEFGTLSSSETLDFNRIHLLLKCIQHVTFELSACINFKTSNSVKNRFCNAITFSRCCAHHCFKYLSMLRRMMLPQSQRLNISVNVTLYSSVTTEGMGRVLSCNSKSWSDGGEFAITVLY